MTKTGLSAIYRSYIDGEIAHVWSVIDKAAIEQQLGV